MTFIATPLNSQSLSVNLACWPQFDAEPINAATIAPLITPRTKAIPVVEDCAQAHGARIHGQSVGSFADVAAWSFCQDKILTTAGEGGMVTTHRADLWDAMWAFKDHGNTQAAVYGREPPPASAGFTSATASRACG